MKNQVIIALSFIILFLTGCSKDNDIGKEELEKVAIQVSGSIVTVPESRASNTSWDRNDTIGIFMLKADLNEVADNVTNRKYSTQGTNNFVPSTSDQTIYYPTDNRTVDFVAYYPYKYSTQPLGCVVNVSDQSNQQAIDFMAAEKVTGKSKSNPNINFQFKHCLTKLEFVIIPGEGITASQLAGLQIELTHQKRTGSYSLYENRLTSSGSDAIIRMKAAADGRSAEGIILPAEATSGREFVFTFTETGLNFSYAIPDEVFNPSEKHIYTVTLSSNSSKSIVVTGRIIPWTKGDDDVNGIVTKE